MRNKVPRPTRRAKLSALVDYYLDSKMYLRLAPSTQKQYYTHLGYACGTPVQDTKKILGDISVSKLKRRHLQTCYDTWVDAGVRQANYRMSIISAALSYGVRSDILDFNPSTGVEKLKTKPRKVRWKREEVLRFLDTAYSDYKWRSIGLIIHMQYTWGQRVGDIRTLTWDMLDLDRGVLDLTQSKRGADVHLPITIDDTGLLAILVQQKKDLGFQDYVAPMPDPKGGSYRPYPVDRIDGVMNEVKAAAGIPKHLTAMDIRRTVIVEMVEGGADAVSIMQASGHASTTSLTPYLVNTLLGSTQALSKRSK